MNVKRTQLFLRAIFASLLVSGFFAGQALAGPAWKFNGNALEGTETVVGAAEKSGMTVPGLTTTCEHFLYELDISNSGGTGKASVTDLPLFDCYTSSAQCTVKSIAAQKLPWPGFLTTVSSKNYIVIESITVNITYAGTKCALGGVTVPVKGTAGGLLDNATESATFNAASFTATGTQLKVGATPIEWNGVFPTEAFEWHREEALSVS